METASLCGFSTLNMPSPKEINPIIDCRVSSTKQQSGGGLGDQESICLNYIDGQGWAKPLKIYKKVYSGRSEERKDFEEIKNDIRNFQKKGVQVHKYVIKSIDRFTRDGAITFSKMKDDLDELGVELVDAYGVIQPAHNTLAHLGFSYPWSMRTPSASAQLQEAEKAKANVSDLLSLMIGASISRVQEGYKVRPPTDGFTNKKVFVEGKRKVIEVSDPERARFFVAMFELRARGMDDPEIVSRINAMGFKTKYRNRYDKDKTKQIGTTGGVPLTVKQLQRIVQKPIYAGIKCETWTKFLPIRAQYDGLVSITLWNEANRGKIFIKENKDGTVQLLHNVTPQNKKRQKNNPDFAYKFLPCDICSKPRLGSKSRGKSGEHFAGYHCGGFKDGVRAHKYVRIAKDEFENSVKELITSLEFTPDFMDSFELVLNDTYRRREKEVVSQSASISLNVGNLKTEQASALDALIVAQNPAVRKMLEQKVGELETKILEAESQRDEIEVTEKDIKAFVRHAKVVMEHPSEMLLNTDNIPAQRALFGLVFDELPTYQEILNGTPKLSLVFKLSSDFGKPKSQSVTLRGIEPRFHP